MDDLRTNGETDELCELNGANEQSAMGGATAGALRTLRVKKTPKHNFSIPSSLTPVQRAISLFFLLCEHDTWAEHRVNYQVLKRSASF